MENTAAFPLVGLGLAVLAVYLLPTILEVWGGRRRAWVVALNALLGWTVVGWVVAGVAAILPPRTVRPPPTAPPRDPSRTTPAPPLSAPRP